MSANNTDSEFVEYGSNGENSRWDRWDGESSPEMQREPDLAVGELMQRLVHEEQMPEMGDLYALSDLSQMDARSVEARWVDIPVEKRRELVEALIHDAEENLQLQLGRLLRIALEDSDPRIRVLAIEGLWEDSASDLIGAFTHILESDPSTEARAAAAAALGPFVLAGELAELDASLAMRAEESLLSVLRDEAEPIPVQCQALESIAYSGEVGVRELIEDAYYSPFDELRVAALNAMGRSADIRWRPLARAELENPSPQMRGSAAIACGELDARECVGDLVMLLGDEEQVVRLAAIFALGRLGGREAREALAEVSDSDLPEESEAAEEALEEMLFYGSAEEIPLFDESLDAAEDSDDDPWDGWYGRDDADLGSYG